MRRIVAIAWSWVIIITRKISCHKGNYHHTVSCTLFIRAKNLLLPKETKNVRDELFIISIPGRPLREWYRTLDTVDIVHCPSSFDTVWCFFRTCASWKGPKSNAFSDRPLEIVPPPTTVLVYWHFESRIIFLKPGKRSPISSIRRIINIIGHVNRTNILPLKSKYALCKRCDILCAIWGILRLKRMNNSKDPSSIVE